jgi:hypothetical protein
MSDISKIDTTELLVISEGQVDVSNYIDIQPVTSSSTVNKIQLDKTNIETYMSDFKKNFYKINFDKVMLEDISELYGIKEDATNVKDLRNKSFEVNEDNNSKEDKLIQPVPIGMRGLISSTNTDLVNSYWWRKKFTST